MRQEKEAGEERNSPHLPLLSALLVEIFNESSIIEGKVKQSN